MSQLSYKAHTVHSLDKLLIFTTLRHSEPVSYCRNNTSHQRSDASYRCCHTAPHAHHCSSTLDNPSFHSCKGSCYQSNMLYRQCAPARRGGNTSHRQNDTSLRSENACFSRGNTSFQQGAASDHQFDTLHHQHVTSNRRLNTVYRQNESLHRCRRIAISGARAVPERLSTSHPTSLQECREQGSDLLSWPRRSEMASTITQDQSTQFTQLGETHNEVSKH